MSKKIRSEKFIDFIYLIIRIVDKIVEIIIHPIKNIAYWMVGVFYILINNANIYKLSGSEMLLISVGLVTIIIFIITFLRSNTVDSSDKKSFYFGMNLKRDLYDNFWIKRFNEMPIRLSLWIIVIIPGLKYIENYQYEYKTLNNISKLLRDIDNYLYCIWISVLIVISIYFAAILIESLYQSNRAFMMSNFYRSEDGIVKDKIKKKIKQSYIRAFDEMLNINIVFLFDSNRYVANDIIMHNFRVAENLAYNQEEFKEFIKCIYEAETESICKKFSEIGKVVDKLCRKGSNKVNHFLLVKHLEKIKLYYIGKWKNLKQSELCESWIPEVLTIANFDLLQLFELENKFIINNEEIKKIYNNIFILDKSINKFSPYNSENYIKNVCVSKIVYKINEVLDNQNVYEYLDFKNDIYRILITLNEIDNSNENQHCISKTFETVFCNVLKPENENNICLNEFNEWLVTKYCNESIRLEAKKCSYSKLMSGDNVNPFQLQLLLNLVNYKEAIISLIFSLAYTERSHKSYMTNDIFKIWKGSFFQFSIDESLIELKNNKFIDEIIDEISKTKASHFLSSRFLQWLWESLFADFDSAKYNEFKELGEKGIRRNFGLSSYIILRSIIQFDFKINKYLFTESEYEEIQKELYSIEKIIGL